jgi:formamidopyrimidine-DNA glycosylase
MPRFSANPPVHLIVGFKKNMPELPEVDTFKRYFDQTARGRRVVDTQVFDAKIIRGLRADEFIGRLANRRFEASYRRGKYLFVALDNGGALLLHYRDVQPFIAKAGSECTEPQPARFACASRIKALFCTGKTIR